MCVFIICSFEVFTAELICKHEKRLPISHLALKLGYINKTHTESGVEKSLFQFSLCLLFRSLWILSSSAYSFAVLCSPLWLMFVYKQTHIHKVELKTLYFNFAWLLQNRVFSYLSWGSEKLLKSQRFKYRWSVNYASSQDHRCMLGDRFLIPFNRRSGKLGSSYLTGKYRQAYCSYCVLPKEEKRLST